MNKTVSRVLAVAVPLALVAGSASAAVDVTAATDGIAEAGVALLAVIGAMLALSVSVYGIVKVYQFISKKSGV